jgi:hypothetical protein
MERVYFQIVYLQHLQKEKEEDPSMHIQLVDFSYPVPIVQEAGWAPRAGLDG